MKQFTQSESYKNEDVYNIVTDELQNLKSLGIVEDWVEVDDLYTNEDGDFYAVQHYYDSYFAVEGHGMNSIVESEPDMRTAVLVLTSTQVLAQMYPEIFTKVI